MSKDDLNWEKLYLKWQLGDYNLGHAVSSPIDIEEIIIDFKGDQIFVGYDWIANTILNQRKEQIAQNIFSFLFYERPTALGVIHTAQMLAEAKDDEEAAAVWIASGMKALLNKTDSARTARTMIELQTIATEFLQQKFNLWRPLQKRRVPKLMVPASVIRALNTEEAEPIIGLIQMNALLLKANYKIIKYRSACADSATHFTIRK